MGVDWRHTCAGGPAAGSARGNVQLPLPLLLQQVGEVVTLVHVVGVLVLLVLQLVHGAPVTLLRQQQLLQHAPVGFPLFLFKSVQLSKQTWERAHLLMTLNHLIDYLTGKRLSLVLPDISPTSSFSLWEVTL